MSHTPSPSGARSQNDTLSQLEARRSELLEQQRLRDLEAEVELLETAGRHVEPDPWLLWEEWGQRLGRSELLNDLGWGQALDPAGAGGHIDDVNARAGGAERPVIENELQLAAIRARARRICQEVPAAIGALRNLTNYVIGTSWSYTVTPRNPDAVPAELVAAVQNRIDQFLETSRWVGCKDRETFRRCVRDGEAFLRLKPDPFGIPCVRFVEPAHVTEPRDPADLEAWLGVHDRFVSSWTWGIHTTQDDVTQPLGYHVVWNGSGDSWDYLSPGELHHIKVGTDENVKRGLSEFYPVRNHFPRAEKVFSMTADGAAFQAAIAGVKQAAEGAKAGDIEALNTGSRTHSRKQWTQWGPRDIDVQSVDRPKVLTIKGYQWVNGPMGSQRNPNLLMAGQAVLRLVGARWNMPEWMTSGDASNNNLASSLVAESPFVKAAQAEQHFYGSTFVELIWKALGMLLGSHPITGVRNLAELRSLLKIDFHPTEVASRDPLQQAQVNQIADEQGWKSKRTIAGEMGLDFDAERENIADDSQSQPGTANHTGNPLRDGLPREERTDG